MANKNLLSNKINFIKVLSFSSFTACLYCLIRNFYFFISNDIPFKWWFDWKYNNYHLSKYLDFGPNYFSTLIIINFLAVYFFRHKLHRLYWLLIGVQLFFLILLSSRGIILFFAVFSIAIFLKKAYTRYNLLGIIFSLIFTIGLIITTFNSIPVLRQRFKKTLIELKSENINEGKVGGLYNRVKKIEAGSNIIQNSPLLGVGIGDVRGELKKQYILMDFKEGIIRSFDAHNQYLESFLASGIMGFISFVSILLYGLNKAVISRDGLYFSLISLFMFFGFLESFMETHKGIVLVSIVILYFFPYNNIERRVLNI
ncbi:O-antigen ligase family protein [Arenibacter sp. F26102]|uniref:O-antigen ligase family protein n=1 Tax=Arenibacter sp. F26102 TaxID=2926416 RepID=UPI001FF482A2|nr:O-antigen ligase family protein [Arenibacter sp. F26102]MCK0144097.1 O-antigen ligase family protein [Arenibacter sp. F26102]